MASSKPAPFNSQNTFLSAKVLPHYFLFPHIGRMDDIWASYYVQALGFKAVFNKASVYQQRNVHDLTHDMRQEYLGYEHNLNLLADLSRNPESITAYLPGRSVWAFNLYRRHFRGCVRFWSPAGPDLSGATSFAAFSISATKFTSSTASRPIPAVSSRRPAGRYSIRVIIGPSASTMRTAATFSDAASATDFDYALHLAAMVGGRLMIENNPLAVADDLSIDAAYWGWAKVARPRKTVTFSSSAAYPIKLQRREHYVLLREDMITFDDDMGMPDMSYGWAKLTCEYLGRLAYEKHGLKSIAYRPFSGYGEDQDDTYPFPSICKRVLANRGAPEVTVWGSGTQMRDFIHIEDCVDAVLATVDQIDDAGAVNLSTGILTSFIDFAALPPSCAVFPRRSGAIRQTRRRVCARRRYRQADRSRSPPQDSFS